MRVYFETFGCTSNQADTEIMKGLVKRHHLVGSRSDCEVVVINSCGVIDRTERKVLKTAQAARAEGKKVVLAGCLSRINPDALSIFKPDSIVTPDSINLINQALDAASNGGSIISSPQQVDKASLRDMKGQLIGAIPIAEGCLGSCSYCGTRFARGRLKSFSKASITDAVERAVMSGTREIQLTAQDTGIYGMDTGPRLPELMKEICTVNGDFKVRVGMMNPTYAAPILEGILQAYECEKVYKFLHLPLQSGDDDVLAHMKRGYRVDDYINIVARFRKAFPGLTLATDVIIGYPTEDEAAFEKTLSIVQALRPGVLNITRFSPRPMTSAAELKDITDRVKKERSRRMSKLAKKIFLENNKKFLGQRMDVLVTENGKNGTFLGRTDEYKQVVLESGVLGEVRRVEITGAEAHYLIGQ
jgi:MiaB-like tRNA modifying enzyme